MALVTTIDAVAVAVVTVTAAVMAVKVLLGTSGNKFCFYEEVLSWRSPLCALLVSNGVRHGGSVW